MEAKQFIEVQSMTLGMAIFEYGKIYAYQHMGLWSAD